ncbi:MAG: SMC-Scp complex subunit ScpB [Planctomycetaceae bacterium]|nr:SMC-Scp complex subunit ScpB [Planctomycetaceae bacterium]
MASLEALLFLSRQPLTSRKLAQLAGLADGTKARTLVRTLNRRYDAEGNAFRVEEVAGGYQLRTRAKFAPWLRRFHAVPVETRLSPALLETLAVVAYRQPVVRAEIDAIRGVQSGEVLRQLIDRELVRIAGRSDELGRPFLYGTTKQFLQVFGLRHLDELPRAEFLRTPEHAPKNGNTIDCSNLNLFNPAAEEEDTVKTLIPTNPRHVMAEDDRRDGIVLPPYDDQPGNQNAYAQREDEDSDDEEEEEEEFEDEEDFDDDDFDEDEDEEEEEEDEDDEEETWEEVEEEDEEEEEDEDWDEDWEDEDWDEDEEDEDEDEDEEDEDWEEEEGEDEGKE